MQAGSRNCQADSPAARAITTSSRRLATTKAAIEPNSVTKGSSSSDMPGSLKAVSTSTCTGSKALALIERVMNSR